MLAGRPHPLLGWGGYQGWAVQGKGIQADQGGGSPSEVGPARSGCFTGHSRHHSDQ